MCRERLRTLSLWTRPILRFGRVALQGEDRRGRPSHYRQPCDLAWEGLLALNMITIEETLVVDAEGHAMLTLPPSVKPGRYRAVVQIEEAASKLGLVLFDGEAAMTGGNELRGGIVRGDAQPRRTDGTDRT